MFAVCGELAWEAPRTLQRLSAVVLWALVYRYIGLTSAACCALGNQTSCSCRDATSRPVNGECLHQRRQSSKTCQSLVSEQNDTAKENKEESGSSIRTGNPPTTSLKEVAGRYLAVCHASSMLEHSSFKSHLSQTTSIKPDLPLSPSCFSLLTLSPKSPPVCTHSLFLLPSPVPLILPTSSAEKRGNPRSATVDR